MHELVLSPAHSSLGLELLCQANHRMKASVFERYLLSLGSPLPLDALLSGYSADEFIGARKNN
jgi:hypothetical protein